VRSIRAGIKHGDNGGSPRLTDDRTLDRGRFRAGARVPPDRPLQRVSEAVTADPGLSKRAIRKTVRGKAEVVELALELLVAEDYIDPREEGQGKPSRHYSLKPYKDETNAPTDRVPTVSRTRWRGPCPMSPPIGTRNTGHGSKDTPTNGDRVPHLEVVS